MAQTADGSLFLAFRRARDPRWLVGDDPASDDGKNAISHLDPRSSLVAMRLSPDLDVIESATPLWGDGDAAEQDPSLLTLGGDRLLLASFSWLPISERLAKRLESTGTRCYRSRHDPGSAFVLWGVSTRRSDDGGRTWNRPRYVPAIPGASDTIPGKRGYLGGATRGSAIVHQDRILLPTYGRVVRPGDRGDTDSCHLYASADRGDTWSYRAPITPHPSLLSAPAQNANANELNANANELAAPKTAPADRRIHFQEPSLCELETGEIAAFLRTNGLEGKLAIARSADGGHSWSEPTVLPIVGHPCHPLRLQNGRILLFYGYRQPPFGVRAAYLDDPETEFVVSDDGKSTDIGYPWAVETSPGVIVVVYYTDSPNGLGAITGEILRIAS